MTWRKPHDRIAPSRELVIHHLKIACEANGVTVADVLAKSRKRAAMQARRDAIRAIHARTPGLYSASGIARHLGLDHSTVFYHLNDAMRAVKNERSSRRHRVSHDMAIWMTTAPHEVRT